MSARIHTSTEGESREMHKHQSVMRRLLRLVPLLFGTTLIASCATGRIDPTDPVGENAKQIDGIMRLSGYMATVVGIFVAAAVVIVIVKFRERPGDDPNELPKQIYMLLPLLLLLLLLLYVFMKL